MPPELRSWGGAPKRWPPVVELGPLPQWKATVKVVPITGIAPAGGGAGLSGSSERVFAIVCHWTGPQLPGLPPHDGPVDVVDEHLVDELELAQAIAAAAADLLRAGEVPFLRHLAQAFDEAGAAWRGRYEQLVGDTGKAAAEGRPVL